MDEKNFLAEQFKANRTHLKSVAYRMLGSTAEAEDAVQETWLRLSRSEGEDIRNLRAWLTTVVSRVCLDMLRSRKSRKEDPFGPGIPEPAAAPEDAGGFEHEAMLADSVGHAMMIVLQHLAPAERIAFVLHDMFDLPFDEIAPIVERSSEATRQLASRARRRVQGKAPEDPETIRANRGIVSAFLAASRDGDFAGLLAVLDPDVVFRADAAAMKLGALAELRGADAVSRAFAGRARNAHVGLIDGAVGVVVVPNDKLLLVIEMEIRDGKIVGIRSIADPGTMEKMDLANMDP